MSRKPGFNKASIERRNRIESLQFNMRLTPGILEMIDLRVRQAINRRAELYELLKPVLDDVDRLRQWNDENLRQLSNAEQDFEV